MKTRHREQSEWIQLLQDKRVKKLWLHDNHPDRPFAALDDRGNKRTDGYLNTVGLYQSHPLFFEELCDDLISLIRGEAKYRAESTPSYIVTPSPSALPYARYIASRFGTLPGTINQNGDLWMAQDADVNQCRILLLDDVVSSGYNISNAADVLHRYKAHVLSFAVVIMARAKQSPDSSIDIVPFFDLDVSTWTKGDCPHTDDGSEPKPPVTLSQSTNALWCSVDELSSGRDGVQTVDDQLALV